VVVSRGAGSSGTGLTSDPGGTLVELVFVSVVGVGVGSGRLLLLQEVGVRDGGKGSGLVDDGGVVDLLLHLNRMVDCRWLDSFTLDNRLDSLVDVVVFVLVNVCTEVFTGPLDFGRVLGVLVRRSLLVELLLVLRKHIFFVFPHNSRGGRLNMFRLENLVVLDRLDPVLVVVYVSLSVDSLGSLSVLFRSDGLLGDFGGDLGADLRRVGLVRSFKEVLDALGDT